MTGAIQLDLFGVVVSAEQRRHVDVLMCLRDAMSDSLEVVAELGYSSKHNTRGPRASGDWAYCVCQAGLRFEDVNEWWVGAPGEPRGWSRTPAELVTWDELTSLVGSDPRRAEVAAWVDGLPMPRWRQLMRPHELGPDPASYHPNYLCHDHVDKEWPARRHAWQLVLDLLDDAINAVTAGVAA